MMRIPAAEHLVEAGAELAVAVCVLTSGGGLAGGSPVGVMAKQPRSWWPARGETRASKRHDKVALGDEQVVGPYDEESCGRVVSKPAKAGTSGSRAPTARAKANGRCEEL